MKIFRKTAYSDLGAVMEIVNAAKAYMKRSGIDQWQDGYPSEQNYLNDIENGISYVVEEDGEIIALSAVNLEYESYYDNIVEGTWLTDWKYGAIHRIAVKENLKGKNIGGFIVNNAVRICLENGIRALRCDTHEDNLSMQRMLTKNGFKRCGIVFIKNKTLRRVAFERILGL